MEPITLQNIYFSARLDNPNQIDGVLTFAIQAVFHYNKTMKLTYRGVFKDPEQLDKGILPENAVKFNEPEDPAKLSIAAAKFLIPAFLLVGILMAISSMLYGGLHLKFTYSGFWLAFILSLLTFLPHEFLHAICFGKKANVDMYVIPKQMMIFVYSPQPISKSQFIFLSLLPNLVFGWIPMLVWVALPPSQFSTSLFYFAALCISYGGGDYLNTYNAIRQMPKGSMQQLSGFNSYWFK